MSNVLATAVLSAILASWAHVHDYTVTIDSREVLGKRTETRTVHYAFRSPDKSRLEVLAGPNRGGVLVWNGGPDVTAYHRGLGFIKVRADGHSARLTSMRGNGIFSSDFGRVLACFDAHRSAVHEGTGPLVDGKPTSTVTLTYDGFTCADDSAQDRDVTRDVLYFNPAGVLVQRERFIGDEAVERWGFRDLRINEGVDDEALR